MNTLSIDPKTISTPELHAYLLSAVAPRPIAFASTIDKEGRVNLSPFSFFNAFSANPPILVFSPARRARDKSTKHTYDNVLDIPEVCINVVNYDMVEQMSLASTEYEKGVNEFVKSGLTPVGSLKIKAPRVRESPAAFECQVLEVKPLGSSGGAGNLVICEVLHLHIQKKYLKTDNTLDSTKLDLAARMGENWYCRANKANMFEIPKPIKTKGIGIDQLPESIRNSTVLTGNNLGRLGNLERLANEKEIAAAKSQEHFRELLSHHQGSTELKQHIHNWGKRLIENGKAPEALSVMMAADRM